MAHREQIIEIMKNATASYIRNLEIVYPEDLRTNHEQLLILLHKCFDEAELNNTKKLLIKSLVFLTKKMILFDEFEYPRDYYNTELFQAFIKYLMIVFTPDQELELSIYTV